ncbi:hypothetical protein PQQ67_05395 [Paraburkholderia aspalathi]|uniref:hypothetical protein n=1 Tax=Paraburkholderia aspalathi TaxID=1324617 RepID=UPI00190D4CA5|nr:hypothetical protein [Paraburkholderia aspalathi]MBK3838030.1 hypothetical protein [Paraburkholderia aspalathi]CAE6720794.1 hypothetical protein R69746_01565 [Paraburkholderia aspalathi]
MTAIANDAVSSFATPSLDSSFSSEDQSIQQLEQQVDAMINQVLQQSSSSVGQNAMVQNASGTLASYMNQNGIKSLDPNQLYQLANNPPAGTPPDVSAAASYMLQNPDVYKQIETHDVSGADGISGVGNFEWAAQGGLDSEPSPSTTDTLDSTSTQGAMMDAQSASGALASYMSQNGISSLDPDQLYKLANNPPAGTPSDVSAAASYMLQNPDVYKQIETHDVSGADGVSGVSNFQWAAQGGLDQTVSGNGSFNLPNLNTDLALNSPNLNLQQTLSV